MAKCGHINKHFYNKDGVLEDLACELEAGHAPVRRVDRQRVKDEKTGEVRDRDIEINEAVHEADYDFNAVDEAKTVVVRERGVNLRKTAYKTERGRARWLDDAGVPAKQETPV